MRGDEVVEVERDILFPNPLYQPNKTIIVVLEFASDELSMNEVFSLIPLELRDHLTGINVRDRRFE